MQKPQSIFLVGPMGAGKTTVGRQLAKCLNMDFADSDSEIEKRTGVDIPLIFELEGESGFRKRETAMIDSLTNQDTIVLATGGGAVLSEQNRGYLVSRGTVIYLNTSIDQIMERTHRDSKRPLLQTDNPRGKLEELAAVRDPLYQSIADITISTESQKIRDVIKEICIKLDKSCESNL
ncbi:Shikimate kinase I [hydrothermal vent metagenome]|uniref:shikimate kinase n=1 Tax=hydrothermal vent metagenome TaxID=652676 RepID=A0A3B1A466_9ZZZZ